MPRRTDIETICLGRLRPDRDRAGGRVRLRGLPGAEGAARGRLPHDRRQLESGDDHDRPRLRRPGRTSSRSISKASPTCCAASGPDAVLPTMGGQTALNLARELAESGILAELGIELIGANLEVIQRAEDRAAVQAGGRVLQPEGADVGASSTSLDDSSTAIAAAGRRPPGVHARRPRRRLRDDAGRAPPPGSRSACARARSARCSSRSPCAAGTSSSSRSSATTSTTS